MDIGTLTPCIAGSHEPTLRSVLLHPQQISIAVVPKMNIFA